MNGSPANQPQDPTLIDVINEISNAPILRQRLLDRLNKLTSRHTISYTSSLAPNPMAFINDWDADVIGNILRSYNKRFDKVDLILHSGGGFAESAERIVNTIYSYCDDFRVIVPMQAKSAATMVAMGASSILMSDSSEIGSIDPQINLPNMIPAPAQSIIKAYDELMHRIEEKQKANQPCDAELVSISKIDPILLRECRRYMDLAKDIGSKLLNKKMRANKPISVAEIEKNFLDDSKTFSHGRLIGWQDAKNLGLEIEYMDKFDAQWKLIWEIHTRSKLFLGNMKLSKMIEDVGNSLNGGQLPVGNR